MLYRIQFDRNVQVENRDYGSTYSTYQIRIDSCDKCLYFFSCLAQVSPSSKYIHRISKYTSGGILTVQIDYDAFTSNNFYLEFRQDTLLGFLSWSNVGDTVFIFDRYGSLLEKDANTAPYKSHTYFENNTYYDFRFGNYHASITRKGVNLNTIAEHRKHHVFQLR